MLWPPPKNWQTIDFGNFSCATKYFGTDLIGLAYDGIKSAAVITRGFNANQAFDISQVFAGLCPLECQGVSLPYSTLATPEIRLTAKRSTSSLPWS